MGFGINRGVGKFTLLAMLLMPDPSSGSQDGTVDGNGTSTCEPGLDQVEQMATSAANLGGFGVGNGFQASFPGTSGGKMALLTEQRSQSLHLGGGLGQHAEQLMHVV
jgi:hypothetical protein